MARGGGVCRLSWRGSVACLSTPAQTLRFETAGALTCVGWENRRAGTSVRLTGPEVELDVGLPGGAVWSPDLRVVGRPSEAEGETLDAVFALADEASGLRVEVRWQAMGDSDVLRKIVRVHNGGDRPLERLLHVRLGEYGVEGARLSDRAGRLVSDPIRRIYAPRRCPGPEAWVERGFPAFIGDCFFVGLEHPAGVAEASGGRVSLRQYPGAALPAGGDWRSMTAVYGAAPAGGAEAAFNEHIQALSRRRRRGHERGISIFEPFGAKADGSFDEDIGFLLECADALAAAKRDHGLEFEYFHVDFWVDWKGDMRAPDPERFPEGFAPLLPRLDALGMKLALWMDSTRGSWGAGGHPPFVNCFTKPDVRPSRTRGGQYLCHASEPFRAKWREAFLHHLRVHRAAMYKFDDFASVCDHPGHGHLPGLYSTEPIVDAVASSFEAFDAENPDLFIMLYWGYKSPWWLRWGDTLQDVGLEIEAASVASLPSFHARDSVTIKLDQATALTPPPPAMNKDSLGVWLSDWAWNSGIGAERWGGAFAVDLHRGSLLAQLWSDTGFLAKGGRAELARMLAAWRALEGAFARCRRVSGDPFREGEAYVYAGCDGERATMALFNPSWRDAAAPVRLDSGWGLPDGGTWRLHRHFPAPARLTDASGGDEFRGQFAYALRPFEVVWLEASRAGSAFAEAAGYPAAAAPSAFAWPSLPLRLETVWESDGARAAEGWTALAPASWTLERGTELKVLEDGSLLTMAEPAWEEAMTLEFDCPPGPLGALRLEALTHPSLPGGGAGWAGLWGGFHVSHVAAELVPSSGAARPVPLTAARSDCDGAGLPVSGLLRRGGKGWGMKSTAAGCVAWLEVAPGIRAEAGERLRVRIEQEDAGFASDDHYAMGRFRVSVSPLPLPGDIGERRARLSGVIPAGAGGLLAVAARLSRNGRPLEFSDIGLAFAAAGELDGVAAPWTAVQAPNSPPSEWQAWRLPAPPSEKARPFVLALAFRLPMEAEPVFSAHYVRF